jgi:hypothetical protein
MAIDPQIPFGALSTVKPFDLGQTLGDIARIRESEKLTALRQQEQTFRQTEFDQAQQERKAQQQAAAERDRVMSQTFPALLRGEIQLDQFVGAVGMETGLKVVNGLKAYQELADKRVVDAKKTAGDLAAAFKVLPPDLQQQLWPGLRTAAKEGGLGELPEQYTPQYGSAVEAWARGPVKGVVVNGRVVDPESGKVIYEGEPETTPVYRQSADKRSIEKVGEVPKGAHIVQEVQPPRVSVNVPTGPGSTGALTEEGVEYAATQYRVTGTMPPMGMGNSQARAAIINEAARQAKGLRLTPAQSIQKQYALKADGAALIRMTNMKAAAESFETKAVAQADIVDGLSKKVGRTASPLLNSWLLAGKREVMGDSDTHLLFNAITTFSTEYAKIMEGSMGSVAASSDAARKAAADLIKATLNPQTLSNTVALMKKEMALTVQGYDATIENITKRMGGASQAPENPPPGPGGLSYQDYLNSRKK